VRCPFHGWKFDAAGHCLDTPAEPYGSTLCQRVRQRAYPVREVAGVLFAWLGRRQHAVGTAGLDAFRHRPATASPSRACGAATGCRPSKSASTRRMRRSCTASCRTKRWTTAYGRQFRGASVGTVDGERWPMTRVMREFHRPEIRHENLAEGHVRLTTLRVINDALTHVRVTNALFPYTFVIPLSETITITQLHVPVDDVSTYWYSVLHQL
jgi:phthalate 4,5-dioxygenase oxygenase subunit